MVIDLKLGKFSHANVGQTCTFILPMPEKPWTHSNENPPVGLILSPVRRMKPWPNMPWRICQTEGTGRQEVDRLALPDKKVLVEELKRTQKLLETQKITLLPKSQP